MPNLAPAAHTLQLSPRGFYGAKMTKDSHASNSRGFMMLALQNTFQFIPSNASNLVQGNPYIDAIWHEYLSANPSTLTYDFENKVLAVMSQAFGEATFGSWYHSQLTSPAFGVTHSAFLDDMMEFIHTGKRNLPVMSWREIVNYRDDSGSPTGHHGLVDPSDEYNEFTRVFCCPTAPYREVKLIRIPELLAVWLSHETGMDDMIATAHILFGSH